MILLAIGFVLGIVVGVVLMVAYASWQEWRDIDRPNQ